MTAQSPSTFDLDERYSQRDGVVLMSGIQALVRALLNRHQLDHQRGLNSGGFVSGYRGSPLGGLDKELWAQSQRLDAANVHFQPGVNEELAATAVWGSQQVGLHPGATHEGVYGLWYGKAPGLDRSCDAIRHANAWGTSANGGVVMVVGDDPAAKSSSLATQSDFALQDMMIPILAPSDVQDVLDFTVLGWELSRTSGLWVGLKAIADHMDSAATIDVSTQRLPHVQMPVAADVHIRREDTPGAQEQRLLEEKLPRALTFARRTGLNKWVTQQHNANGQKGRLGIISAGKAYQDVREACAQLGLITEGDIHRAGIEILKLGMTWPLDDVLVKRFSSEVECLLVIEEKRAFVEPLVKEALYGITPMVPVLGKYDRNAKPLIPATGILNVADIASILAQQAELKDSPWLASLARARTVTQQIDAPARKERTPLFCAGCPHNTSTRVPKGSRATAGIGCHYMVQWMDRETDSCTQMGGEGVTWVGEAPFTQEKHIFANLGDGTYFHSGILAIRQAVAAKVNITYKILFNDAVAMTGGQPTDGELSVSDLVAQVRAEGVQKVVIVSDEPALHTNLAGAHVSVFDRNELDNVQRNLAQVSGTTVLIYQQTCATELRRRRKRHLISDVKPRVMINEAVCDGCGDCSVQSNCVAVEPVETELGIKRKINQTNCNKDLSCAEGYCPAFVEVTGELAKPQTRAMDLGEVKSRVDEPKLDRATANILITGVGGTGIVTLSALLAAAAKIDGKQIRTLDMTGLAQKGGAVFAHIRIGEGRIGESRIGEYGLHSPRIPDGRADVLVGCDLVSAASNEALELLDRHTQCVVNSHVTPTADFVLSQSADMKLRHRLKRLAKVVETSITFAAEDHIEALLGDTQQANVMLLGYAYQLGGIPLSLAAIEEAILVNNVAVQRNLLAFHLGRVAAVDEALLYPDEATPTMTKVQQPMQLSALIAHRSQFLNDYHNLQLSQRYQTLVARVQATEEQIRGGSEQLTRAVARSYAKVLAVKDEYEVARLYVDGRFQDTLARQFSPDAKMTYLMAPPLMGTKKRRFGSWMSTPLKVLAKVRTIRNSWMDPLRFSDERRAALAQIEHFEEVVEMLLAGLNLQNLAIAVAIAKLPLKVRGFGHVKAAQWQKAHEEEQRLLAEFHTPGTPVTIFDPAKQAAA